MSEDDFQKADTDAGVPIGMEVLPPEKSGTVSSTPTSDLIQFRKQLVTQYYEGSSGLAERLKKAGMEDLESLVVELLSEMVKETDNLLGNELIAMHNGELRDSSVISFKRAEVLEKAWKASHTKRQFEKQDGINLDSPAMMVIFRFFMSKAKETFVRMGVDREISDLFFRRFGEVTNDWKKELRETFDLPGNQG